MSKQHFKQFKFLIILSPDLEESEVGNLENLLISNGSNSIIKISQYESPNLEEFQLCQITHVVSNTMDFQYKDFALKNLIPVVRPQWVYHSINQRRIQPLRPYNPDEVKYFRKVYATLGDDIPENDRLILEFMIVCAGGQVNKVVTKFTTHIVSATTTSDAFLIASSINNKKYKCVIPQWVDDCVLQKCIVNENDYLLDNLKIELDCDEDLNIMGTFKEDIYQAKTVAKNHYNGSLFKEKTFHLSKNLKLGERLRNLIINLIINNQGKFNHEFSNGDFFIGLYREDPDYIEASRNQLIIGNINWFFTILNIEKIISPFENLLYYPIYQTPIKEFENLKISGTNYTGDGRQYIQNLVNLLGAKYNSTLDPNVDYLICSKPEGDKYEAATTWENVKIKSHKWLETCYKEWKFIEEGFDEIEKPIKFNEMLGQIKFDESFVKKFWKGNDEEEIDDEKEEDKEEIEDSQEAYKDDDIKDDYKDDFLKDLSEIDDKLEEQERNVENVEKDVNDYEERSIDGIEEEQDDKIDEKIKVDIEEELESKIEENLIPDIEEERGDKMEDILEENVVPEPNKETDIEIEKEDKIVEKKSNKQKKKLADLENKENLIPDPVPYTSLRKAAKKAAEKLHSDMEDLNEFQKRSSHKNFKLPEEIKVKEKIKQLKRKSEIGIEEENKKFKNNKNYKFNIIITGYEIDEEILPILSSFGIEIVNDPLKANVLMAPRIMRTEKFLVGLSNGIKFILHPNFLKMIVKKGNLIDPKDYSLEKIDPNVNKDLKISIEKLLKKYSDRIVNHEKLFKGFKFNVTNFVPGNSQVLNKILLSHGSEKKVKLLKNPRQVTIKNIEISEIDQCVLITSNEINNEESEIIEKFKKTVEKNKKLAKVVSWDWIVNSVFNSELS